MEVMKQSALVLVSYALMACSAIRLVLLLLMGSVRLVTTVQLDSQLGHHRHMFVHVEIGVLQAMAVLENANLDTIKMNLKQDTCKQCPRRYYCNATFGGVENYNLYVCPEGYYCPNGTRYAEEFPCQIGTFNNLTGRASQSECTPCLPRFYCGEPGLTHPRTLCSAGYYCKTGNRLIVHIIV